MNETKPEKMWSTNTSAILLIFFAVAVVLGASVVTIIRFQNLGMTSFDYSAIIALVVTLVIAVLVTIIMTLLRNRSTQNQ